jgi:large subunit ribosomal protein L9
MKVILLQDVAKIGKRSQIVEVPDGYARNQLIPKMMAESATKANQKRIEKLQSVASESAQTNQERFGTAIESLREKVIQVAAEVNEQGHTFKAVAASEISAAAKASDVDIDSTMISIPAPIKSLGEHEIELLGEKTSAKFSIEVIKK